MAKTTPAPRRNRRSALEKLAADFSEWLSLRDAADMTDDRISDLRGRMMRVCEELGEVDDKGNGWVDLPEPVGFQTHKGKKSLFTALKRERHLIPANPTPDPDLAEKLLRKKHLWLKPEQEAALEALREACPYVRVSVTVDTDAVALALFKGLLKEREYEKILVPQRESFHFIPCENR